MAFALLGLLLAPVAVAPARAEHEIYYRYVVLGFVKDAQGRRWRARAAADPRQDRLLVPGADRRRRLLPDRRASRRRERGESLTLRAGTIATRLVAAFDPANHTEHRGARVDLEGTRFVEQRAGSRRRCSTRLARRRVEGAGGVR